MTADTSAAGARWTREHRKKELRTMGSNLKRRAMGLLALALVGGAMVAVPATAAAKDGDVIRTGACTNRSDWKLKLSPEDGRIEVEFEVDTPKVGQTWNVRIKKNGNVIWQGTRTTTSPSGSFEVRKVTGNPAGSDFFVGRAKNPKTGEICRGTATF
jgi:hypothetical protein